MIAVIPHPGLGIDWLADRAQQTKRRKIVFQRPLLAPLDERANCRRRGVENVDPVPLDDVPEAIRLRPVRRAFIHQRGRPVRERSVDNITVARDPTNVRRAPVDVFIFQIEDPFGGQVGLQQVAAGRVQNAFRFSGRAGRVKNEQRMFAVQFLGSGIQR